jgi:hypothetical protein
MNPRIAEALGGALEEHTSAMSRHFGEGGIAERLVKLLEQRSEVETLHDQLAAAQAKLAEVEKERAYYKLVSEGWSEDEARGEVWPAAAEQGGAPWHNAQEELAAANAQRDDLRARLHKVVGLVAEAADLLPGRIDERDRAGELLCEALGIGLSTSPKCAQSGQPSRDWPEDAAHENGQ